MKMLQKNFSQLDILQFHNFQIVGSSFNHSKLSKDKGYSL